MLIVSIGLFACKDKDVNGRESLIELSARAVETVIPKGGNNAEIATALPSLFAEAGLEEAESTAVLLALIDDEAPMKYEYALTDATAGVMRAEHAASYRAALTAIAGAVSPEVAGAVYYAATKKENADLPYTLEDCRKLASLILSQNAAFDLNILENAAQSGTFSMSEKEANTAILSLAASLRKAVGITQGAKDYLCDFANAKIDELSEGEDLSEETQTALLRLRTLLRSLVAGLRDRYDLALIYAAEYLSAGDARILLGQQYDRQEVAVYYGFRYADRSSEEITKEDYLAHRGDYDEYLERRMTRKGVTVNGLFLAVTDEDEERTDRIYRLSVAFRAYNALGDSDKTALRAALPELFAILSENQSVVAELTERPIIEDSGAPAASLDDLLAALPSALTYDATDGITDAERAVATNVLEVFESYLHGYLPRVY